MIDCEDCARLAPYEVECRRCVRLRRRAITSASGWYDQTKPRRADAGAAPANLYAPWDPWKGDREALDRAHDPWADERRQLNAYGI